jgi:small subunit ribosomal protein S18
MERRERSERSEKRSEGRKSQVFVKKDCKFCEDQVVVDFTQTELLRKFMTESGRILPRRYTGNCARHQRELTRAIKHARTMLLVP